MMPHCVVVFSPPLDQYLHPEECVEALYIQGLVPQLPIERFQISMLRGLPGSMHSVFTTRSVNACRKVVADHPTMEAKCIDMENRILK